MKNETIILKRGLSKDWLTSLNKYIALVPKEAVPTTIGNFASFKKVTNRKLQTNNEKLKYGVTVTGSSISIPKEIVPQDIIKKKRDAGWLNERVFEIAKEIRIEDQFTNQSIQSVGLNSKVFKTKQEIFDRKNKVNDLYEKQKGNKWFLNLTLEGVLVHELGHVFSNRTYIDSSTEWKDIWYLWKKDCNLGLMHYSESEAFSEAFSNYYVEQGKDLPTYVKTFIENKVK